MNCIIVNGPPGVGKSTLCRQLHATQPKTVYLEVDEVRRLLSSDVEQKESHQMAFELTLAPMEKAFSNQYNVIVDKMIFDSSEMPPRYLQKMIKLAEENGVRVFEFILIANKDTVVKRASERGFKEGGRLTLEKVGIFYDGVMLFSKQRKDAYVIDTNARTKGEVYNQVLKIII